MSSSTAKGVTVGGVFGNIIKELYTDFHGRVRHRGTDVLQQHRAYSSQERGLG